MDINCYLPEELGARAKEEELPFSRLLRDAVEDELRRREAMKQALEDPQEYEMDLEDRDGHPYTGRVTGKLLADDHDRWGQRTAVYLTEDERVIVHYGTTYLEFADPEDEEQIGEVLRQSLSPGMYAMAMKALGFKPVIDL